MLLALLVKFGNYLTSQYVKLRHLTMGQCVNETDSSKLLEYFEHGKKTYIEFRNERFVGKTKALSHVIRKFHYHRLN